jgi:hypothetical protein
VCIWVKAMAAWAHFTGPGMNLCSFLETAKKRTSTMFSSAASGAIAPTSGITPAPTAFRVKGQGSALDLHPTVKPIAMA